MLRDTVKIWKSVNAPNIGRWLKEMITNMLMEKIRDKYIIFYVVWGHFKLFIKCGGVGNVLLVDKKKRWYCILTYLFLMHVFSLLHGNVYALVYC